MNTNNVRIVLEEVLKVGNVARKKLPQNIDDMTPRQQVWDYGYHSSKATTIKFIVPYSTAGSFRLIFQGKESINPYSLKAQPISH